MENEELSPWEGMGDCVMPAPFPQDPPVQGCPSLRSAQSPISQRGPWRGREGVSPAPCTARGLLALSSVWLSHSRTHCLGTQ